MVKISRRMALGLIAVVAAVAVGTALIFVMRSESASAMEVLENARNTSRTVLTYKVTMDAWQAPQVEGDAPRFETSTEAVVVFSQGMHVVMRGNGSYGETLLLNGKQYRRETAGGTWEEYPGNFGSSLMAGLDSAKHFEILDGLEDSKIVGEETLDGIRVRKITGGFDLQEKARGIWGDPPEGSAAYEGSKEPRQQMLAGEENVVVWVGIEEGLIHAYEVSGSYPAVGELLAFEFWRRVRFSEFDQPLVLPSVEATAEISQ